MILEHRSGPCRDKVPKLQGQLHALRTSRRSQQVVHDRTDNPTRALLAAESTLHAVAVLRALFPSPTGSMPPRTPALEEGEEEDWEPDAEDLRELGAVGWWDQA